MALTPQQESEYLTRLEGLSVSLVRSDLESGKIQPHLIHATATWLSAKEREAEARREASNAEQIELARRTSEAAERAASEAERASAAAERSATAAERQAGAAERANTRATIAIVIATISIIVAAVSIWITHMDAHK
jgi:hypothetical protein